MTIDKNEMKAGLVLTANYKKETHECNVAERDGKLIYILPGREEGSHIEFTSPSAAGSAVMGGIACNGWRFWSIKGGATHTAVAAPKPEAAAKPAPAVDEQPERKASKVIKRTANQKGVPEGQVRYFCSASMTGFYAPEGDFPEHCPEGHLVLTDDVGNVQTIALEPAAD